MQRGAAELLSRVQAHMPGEGKGFSPLEEVRPREKGLIFCRDLRCLHGGKQFCRYGYACTSGLRQRGKAFVATDTWAFSPG